MEGVANFFAHPTVLSLLTAILRFFCNFTGAIVLYRNCVRRTAVFPAYRCPCHVYQGTIHADKVIAYLPERSEFEIIQHRNVKDVREITPLRGYSPPFNAFKSSTKWVHDEEESNRYFNEWYQSQNS